MNIIKQIFLLVLPFIVVVIMAELFVKSAKISEVSFAEYYDDIGKGLAPADTYVFFNEGFGITSTNSSRFIGEDVAIKKDENTIRIALIGDSYVESIQVFERHYFGNIAEEILNEKYNQKSIKIEILNFGRNSFHLGNMYAYQRLFIDKFDADYVLYFVSEYDLKWDRNFPPLLPITTIENNNLKTSIDISEHHIGAYKKSKFLTQKTALGNILNSCRRKIKNKKTLPIVLGKFYTETPQTNNSIQSNNKEDYQIDIITHKIINALDTNTIIVNREDYKLPLEFENLCLDNNLHYLELNSTFESLKTSGVTYNKWNATNTFGHWNQHAHKAIGEKIAKEMDRIIQQSLINTRD